MNEVQSQSIVKPTADFEERIIQGGPTGRVSIKIVRPPNAPEQLPDIVYSHGAGWVFGNAHTHDRLIRELAVGAQAVVVFPNYSLSLGSIRKQLLFYPVTDASFDTKSYHQFATGYFLRRDAMQWFWDQYTTDPVERAQITASPLRATTEQLRGLPPALIITGEADVLRDEGKGYADKLREAGVEVIAVRFQGIIHDFVMLHALADTVAARGALMFANSWLRT